MKLVTVFSASGRPGLAQVRQLLLAGYKVRAVTRESKRLEHFEGIEIISADYNQFITHVLEQTQSSLLHPLLKNHTKEWISVRQLELPLKKLVLEELSSILVAGEMMKKKLVRLDMMQAD